MNTSRTAGDSANRREYWAPLLELAAQEVFGLMLGNRLEAASEPILVDSLDVTSMVGLTAFAACSLSAAAARLPD